MFDETEILHSHQEQTDVRFLKITKMLLMFIFFWQGTFRVSDVGIDILLGFLPIFMLTLSTILGIHTLREFALQLPKSTIAGRRVLGTDVDGFTRWACCQSCSSIYPADECKLKLPNGQFVSKKCSFVRFPNHPQLWRRKTCGCSLLKTAKTSAGTTILRPVQVYCYRSIVSSLKEFLQRSDFFNQCERWRSRSTEPDTLYDVYDGSMWKDFMEVEGVPFLSVPYNYALSLNVDWFQPFKHTQHSVGVLYMAVQNLPREIRFLAENILIVGIIPGPHEPSKNINSFLTPLVDELKDLWRGIFIETGASQLVLVRAALICVACDIPAARKVCGFVGHQAYRGCSKCLKGFPTDYSGFNRDSWTLRDSESHRQNAYRHQAACTATHQAELERELL